MQDCSFEGKLKVRGHLFLFTLVNELAYCELDHGPLLPKTNHGATSSTQPHAKNAPQGGCIFFLPCVCAHWWGVQIGGGSAVAGVRAYR